MVHHQNTSATLRAVMHTLEFQSATFLALDAILRLTFILFRFLKVLFLQKAWIKRRTSNPVTPKRHSRKEGWNNNLKCHDDLIHASEARILPIDKEIPICITWTQDYHEHVKEILSSVPKPLIYKVENPLNQANIFHLSIFYAVALMI